MKKTEEQYKKWIESMFHKYKSILFIEKYHFKVEKDEDKETYLASKFNYPYLDCKILYSEKSLKDWQKDKQEAERRIVHEFCHIVTDPFYCVIMNFPTKKAIESERERLTDHIASIVNKHLTKLSN